MLIFEQRTRRIATAKLPPGRIPEASWRSPASRCGAGKTSATVLTLTVAQGLLRERDADLQRCKMIIKLKEGLITRLEVRALKLRAPLQSTFWCHAGKCWCRRHARRFKCPVVSPPAFALAAPAVLTSLLQNPGVSQCCRRSR